MNTHTRTGISSVAELVGRSDRGENVVWIGDKKTTGLVEISSLSANHDPIVLVGRADDTHRPTHHVPIAGTPELVRHAIIELADTSRNSRFVIRLDDAIGEWGPDATADLFVWVCPRLYEKNAPATWLVSTELITPMLRRQILEVTQCVVEHEKNRLRVVKADGRPGIIGRTYELLTNPHGLELREMPAGRLGETLRRIRRERGMTQADLASLAGVSPSAISQVEKGQRGMALDTAATLAYQLGITVDDLLDRRGESGHILGRRSVIEGNATVAWLFDDPHQPLRTLRIRLENGQADQPPKGARRGEVLLVYEGVLQVEVGGRLSTLRSGDGLLATTDRITGWRNLLDRPALGFWVAG